MGIYANAATRKNISVVERFKASRQQNQNAQRRKLESLREERQRELKQIQPGTVGYGTNQITGEIEEGDEIDDEELAGYDSESSSEEDDEMGDEELGAFQDAKSPDKKFLGLRF